MAYPSPYGQHGWARLPDRGTRPTYEHDNASAMHVQSFYVRNARVRHRMGKALPVILYLVYFSAILYLPIELYFLSRPGPIVYRNSYPSLILAICLALTCIQLIFLNHGSTTYTQSRLRCWTVRVYWGTVTLCTLIYTICNAVARKYDCLVGGVVTLMACGFVWQQLHELRRQQLEKLRQTGQDVPSSTIAEPLEAEVARISWYSPTRKSMINRTPASPPMKNERDTSVRVTADPTDDDADDIPWYRSQRKQLMMVACGIRPFRPFHVIVVILNMLGSIQLARHSQIKLPGERISIKVPEYGETYVNVLCTTQSVQNPGNKSMVWFEGSSSQGIMDFQGVQHYLLDHDIASCSYDPPSFGGSDALTMATIKLDYSRWQPALAKALRRSKVGRLPKGNVTFVGWGASGTALAVKHALEDTRDASSVLAIDPVPNDAGYVFDASLSSKPNETPNMAKTLRLRHLNSEIDHHRLALSFGVTWGLLFSFSSLLPARPRDYWPPTELEIRQSQYLRDDYLASQYWKLHRDTQTETNMDIDDRYLSSITLPEHVRLQSIFSWSNDTSDPKANVTWQTYRLIQMSRVDRNLRNKSAESTKCWGCTEDFVISKAKWTADQIALML